MLRVRLLSSTKVPGQTFCRSSSRALLWARRANQIGAANPGTDAAQHALLLVNLALVENQAGHFEDAKQHFEQGMAIAGKSVLPLHPVLPAILKSGAGYLRDAGRKRDAKQLDKRADSIITAIARNTSLGKTVDYQSFR